MHNCRLLIRPRRAVAIAAAALGALLLCSACARPADTGPEQATDPLQRYARLEIYAAEDMELLAAYEDRETLTRFVAESAGAVVEDAQADEYLEQQEALRDALAAHAPEYVVASYKRPAALFNDGSLEKISEMTLYAGTNLVKEQVAAEAIKNFTASPDALAFYHELPESMAAFLRLLAQAG